MRPAIVLAALLLTASGAAARSSAPTWRIVFSSARTGTAQLYSIEPSGRGLAQLTFGTDDALAPLPSPDGRQLLYSTPSSLRLVSADGRSSRGALAPGGHSPAWSPDSRSLAYVDYEQSVRVVRGPLPGVTAVVDRGRAGVPAWSRDGRLAFVRYGGQGEPLGRLVVRTGTHEVVVASEAGGISSLAWSPDGRMLAYTFESDVGAGVAVVTPGGRRRILHASTGPVPAARPLTWAPDGQRLAFVDSGAISTVDLGGHVRRLASLGAIALAWSPAGDAIAAGDGARIAVVSLDGRVRTIFRSAHDDALTTVAWQLPPRTARLRAPEAIRPAAEATGNDLRIRYPIGNLAANGERVAFTTCFGTATWTPGSVPVGPPATTCRFVTPNHGRPSVLGLARSPDRLAVLTWGGGIGRYWWLDVLAGGATAHIGDGGDCCGGDPTLPPVGYLFGAGDELVYSAWTRCVDCAGDEVSGIPSVHSRIASQTIFRLDPAGPPVAIATASGGFEPFAFDGTRLVVRRHVTGIDVLDTNGRLLLSWELGVRMLGAELAGNDLVVLVPGELRDYDAATGNLLRTYPMPAAQSGGYCGRNDCATPDVLLAGAASGIVAYTLAGQVHVVDLRTGKDGLVAAATSARLTTAGLFYAYGVPGPWPSRIRFVSLGELRPAGSAPRARP